MPGETDLERMLRTLEPAIRLEPYVYAVVPSMAAAAELPAEAVVVEVEGVTVVLPQPAADAAGLGYDFVGAWITLTVHSSLEAVGLTAAFATALAGAGIGCNVIAGAVHDHILVPWDQRDAAVAVLRGLRDA